MSRLLPLSAAVVLLAAGCTGQSAWTSVEDCEGLSSGADADECWARYAPDLFKADAARGIEVVENKVSDQRVRDFIWLTVTREVDPSSYKYCDRIKEPALGERCRVLVSRPHLHRELLKERDGGAGGPKAGGPGGPPAGAGGPPPPGGGAGGPPPAKGSPGAPPPGGGASGAAGAPPPPG